MKQFRKYLYAGVTTLILLCAGRTDARAQFVVTDPGNLMQAILQFCTDEAGWYENIVEYAKIHEKWDEHYKEFKNSIEIAKGFIGGMGTAMSIYDCGDQIVSMGAELQAMKQFFNAEGATAYYYQASATKKAFDEVAKEMLTQTQNDIAQLGKMKEADGISYLDLVKKMVDELNRNLKVVQTSSVRTCARYYQQYLAEQDGKRNRDLMKTVIY